MSRLGMWIQRAYAVPQKTQAITLALAAVVLLYMTAAASFVLYRLDQPDPHTPVWVSPSDMSVVLFSGNEIPVSTRGTKACLHDATLYTCVQAEI